MQSQASMHAVKNWLEGQLGSKLSSRFAYLVSLPYTDVPQGWAMAGCPRALILDRVDTGSIAAKVRHAIEHEGSGATSLAPVFLERIARKLCGDLDANAGPLPDPHEAEDAQEHLTVRQSVLLRATRSIPRARFTGGAGSGKTWLALEKSRLLCKQGKRVGLFCYNKGLSQYLQLQVDGWRQARPVFTGEFHEYVRALGIPDGSGTDYFEEEMPRLLREMAGRMEPHERLDAVVVDEAQDFAPLWWESLLACTKDPDAGEVYAFMDDRQDVYQRWKGAGSDDMHPTADLVPIHIDDNLRNTIKIAETFRGFAGEHFTLRGGTGLPVRRVDCATEDALDAADECVEALMDEGWSPNQIALLTTKSRHPVHQERFDAGSIAEYWLDFHANNDVFYGHVLGFKGLERSAVVLCVNGFKDMERAAEQLYVGLSRARSLLVVVGDSGLLESAGGRDLKAALARAEVWQPAVVGRL
ncbi:hypothetical protein ACRQ5B_02155 [Pseudarthrobacter sp. L19]|uniref:hypothetical protein n=1 Tax=Pseudarthrobacter sp. L19 TaxID=3423951 RepID=UPI003D7A43B5